MNLLAGLGIAAREGMRSYKNVNDIERDATREQRAQETHEASMAEGTMRRTRAAGELEDWQRDRGQTEGARQAGIRALSDAATPPADFIGDDGPGAQPRTLTSASEPATARAPVTLDGSTGAIVEGGETIGKPAATAQAAPAAPAAPASSPIFQQASLPFRQAAAQREYWIGQGRPDKATKVMTDAISGEIAGREALFKYDLMPRMEKLRTMGLSGEELKKNAEYQDLREQLVKHQTATLGQIYGLARTGNERDAVRLFNESSLVMPGTKIAGLRLTEDGNNVVAIDERGEVAKDPEGQPLSRPKAWFDRVWQLSQTSDFTLAKGQERFRSIANPDGSATVRSLAKAADPEAQRRAQADERRVVTDKRADDKAWSDVINKARDDSHRYIKDSLGLTANAMGQIMNPENQPLFERAQPYVEEALGTLRGAGKRLDEVQATSIAKKALDRARDEIKREKAGAGPRAGGAAAAPTGGSNPTWRDVLK